MDNNFTQNPTNQQNYGYSQQNNYQGFDIPNNNTNMYNQYNIQQEEPKKKKTMLIVLIILGLLCLCCGGSCVAAIATGNVSFSTNSSSSNNDLIEELKNLDQKQSSKKDKDEEYDDYFIEDEDEDEDENENENEDKDDKEPIMTGNLKEHSTEIPTITIDGVELTFGYTLGELEDKGYEILIDEYTNFDLEQEITNSYFYEYVHLKTPKGNVIEVWIENFGDTPTTPRECYIVAYEVEYDEYYDEYKATAKLDNGVTLNKTTLEEFEETYPNPDYEYISDDNTYISYSYYVRIDDTTSVDYSYTFIDGELIEIGITASIY